MTGKELTIIIDDRLEEMQMSQKQSLHLHHAKSPAKSTKPLKLLGFGVITSGYNCSHLTAKVLSKCCQKW